MRRRPVLAGMVVGGAIASHAQSKAQAQQQQQMQMQQSQAQLAQAQAEANYAKQQAAQYQQQPQPQAQVVYQASYAPPPPPPQQYAPPPPQQYAPPPPPQPKPQQQTDVGRSMLNEALSSDNNDVATLNALKKQLTVTQMMCEQALGLYKKSLELNKAAQKTNMGGVVLDRFTRAPGLDLAMDSKRDAQVKASTQPAEQASQMLVQGFAKIPDALRLRYPSEMSQVGNVPEASLRVGSFGKTVLMGAAFGQRGENMNDAMMAKKIADNEREIGQCMQVVQKQLQLMQIVQARLDQDLAHASSQAPQAVAIAAAAAPPPVRAAPPPTTPSEVFLELKAPHVVDEAAMAPYGIISVPQGATVRLVKGTLENGLDGAYQDYIEVEYQGRVGKISRLVVSVKKSAGPPPPLTMAPPPPPPALPPPAMDYVLLRLKAAHVVDEAAMAPYGIISVPMGSLVRLKKGDLENGLGDAYKDYIEVEFQGRVGKISRLVVEKV